MQRPDDEQHDRPEDAVGDGLERDAVNDDGARLPEFQPQRSNAEPLRARPDGDRKVAVNDDDRKLIVKPLEQRLLRRWLPENLVERPNPSAARSSPQVISTSDLFCRVCERPK